MTRLPALFHRAGLAVLLGLGVAFAADAQPAARLSADARLDQLTEGLDLTADQSAALDALGTRYADADRATLWTAAADVAAILTDAQIDQLQQAATARRSERSGARGERTRRPRGERRARPDGERRARPDGERRARPDGDRRQRAPRGERTELTDAQREALRAVRDDVRARTEALVTQFRDGALTEDQFVERTKALREEATRRSAEALPAEAAQRMAERHAQRDAEKTARERALGLTDAQKAQLQSRRLDRVREGGPDLRPFLDEGAELDRDAMREALRERREQARAEREADPVLTAEQQDVVFLHRALAGGGRDGHRGRRGQGRRGGRMGR